MSHVQNTFVPKQACPRDPQHMTELVGDVSETVIQHVLSQLPAFSPGAVILDNATGTGTVTAAIMATNPPIDITIHATDMLPPMVAGVEANATAHKWPVKAEVMLAQSLTFPDNYFTHSFMNFAILALPEPDDLEALQHVHRTLKPGGTAVVTSWALMPHMNSIEAAHAAVRPPGTPLATKVPERWFRADHLQSMLQKSGFAPDRIQMKQSEAVLKVKDLRRWAWLGWSFLGVPPTGWTEADERDWDKALDAVVRKLETDEMVEKTSTGEWHLRMVANIAVVAK